MMGVCLGTGTKGRCDAGDQSQLGDSEEGRQDGREKRTGDRKCLDGER